jgi:hypothetical protein
MLIDDLVYGQSLPDRMLRTSILLSAGIVGLFLI